jgi:N-acetylneuraminic acid mutarotase
VETVFSAVLLLLLGTALTAFAQTPAVTHNTWNTGTPMRIAADGTAVSVLDEQIYVVGGQNGSKILADNQIYNPATNKWSTGTPLPIATTNGCAAVVNNVLYFIDGYTGTITDPQDTAAVWAYSLKTQTWSSKTPMLTARRSVVCVVEKDVIYIMGGYNNGSFLSTVESYNPATDTSQSEASMLSPESDVSAALLGSTIVVTDGSDNVVDGHNQAYDAAANTWSWLNSDPAFRQGTCAGSIDGRLYSAGGWDAFNNTVLTVTESYTLSKNAWETLARMPKATMGLGRSVAYKGQLYCFGGEYSNDGNVVSHVEIYQP